MLTEKNGPITTRCIIKFSLTHTHATASLQPPSPAKLFSMITLALLYVSDLGDELIKSKPLEKTVYIIVQRYKVLNISTNS